MLAVIVWIIFAVLPMTFVLDQPYIFMGTLWTWAALFVTGIILTMRDAKSRRTSGETGLASSEIAAIVCSLVGIFVTVNIARFVIAIIKPVV